MLEHLGLRGRMRSAALDDSGSLRALTPFSDPAPPLFHPVTIEEVFVSSSNARKVPEQVLNHPAVVALVEKGARGSLSPEDVRRASEEAQVEPRHLKGLLAHLTTLGISVHIDLSASRVAAATTTKKTTTAPAKKAAATKAPAKKADTNGTTKTAAAKKGAAPAKKAAPATQAGDTEPAAEEGSEEAAVGADGKKVLPDISDDQFEKDVATDPSIEEDEKEASFVVSD